VPTLLALKHVIKKIDENKKMRKMIVIVFKLQMKTKKQRKNIKISLPFYQWQIGR
jgi:hypothetical protein